MFILGSTRDRELITAIEEGCIVTVPEGLISSPLSVTLISVYPKDANIRPLVTAEPKCIILK